MSVHLDRLKQQARAVLARVRPRHVAALAGVAVVGVGVAAVGAMARPEAPTISESDRLRIQVVTPPEPEIRPGSVMEVGHLVDGFVYTPPPRATREFDPYAEYDEGFDPPSEPRRRKPSVREDDGYARTERGPPPEDRRDGWAARLFGFDAPEPDYEAEREARRERMRAQLERDYEAGRVRRYRSDGAGRDRRDDRPRDDDPGPDDRY